jgi:transposase
MPRSPGHVFCDRLQAELVSAGFDGFVENRCATHYAARRGRPSLPPGRYFRMLDLLVDPFIPSPPGNALQKPAWASTTPVHPRACGERNPPVPPAHAAPGSSPRLRGTLLLEH